MKSERVLPCPHLVLGANVPDRGQCSETGWKNDLHLRANLRQWWHERIPRHIKVNLLELLPSRTFIHLRLTCPSRSCMLFANDSSSASFPPPTSPAPDNTAFQLTSSRTPAHEGPLHASRLLSLRTLNFTRLLARAYPTTIGSVNTGRTAGKRSKPDSRAIERAADHQHSHPLPSLSDSHLHRLNHTVKQQRREWSRSSRKASGGRIAAGTHFFVLPTALHIVLRRRAISRCIAMHAFWIAFANSLDLSSRPLFHECLTPRLCLHPACWAACCKT